MLCHSRLVYGSEFSIPVVVGGIKAEQVGSDGVGNEGSFVTIGGC